MNEEFAPSGFSNVKIVRGTGIPVSSGETVSWSFSKLDFRDIDVYTMKYIPYSSKLREMMRGKNAMIVIENISFLPGAIDENIISTPGRRNDIGNYPCCVRSQSGALMPQIMIPTEGSEIADNGIVFGDDMREDSKTIENGYTWIANDIGMKELRYYGKRNDEGKYAGYIDMSDSRSPADSMYIATRSYSLNGKGIYSDNSGACAFMCGFTALSGPHEGNPAVVPKVYVNVNGKTSSKRLAMSMASDMDLFARYGDDTGQGTISNPSGSFYPPQHKSIGGTCVFIYPLYSGVVFSGTGTKQLNENNFSGCYVPFTGLRDPMESLTVENAHKSYEMEASIKEDPDSEMMWLPTLIEEARSPLSVRLRVKPSVAGYNVIYSGMNIEWIKAEGKFAYSPVFFIKNLRFHLYFKGDFSPSKDGGDTVERKSRTDYFIYPIAAGANSSEGDWESLDEIVNTNIDKQGTSAIMATLAANGDNETESIYRSEFNFIAKEGSKSRNPMEVFGCIVAARTTGQSMGILNDNGNMVFDEFSPGCNPYFSSDKLCPTMSFYDFISSATISSSFQGVTGSLNIDMFATDINIGNIDIKQYIGELCFRVNKSHANLFTGYGMELKQVLSETNHSIGIRLEGIQKKLSDMKLVCCPFWDGDRLEMICNYFQAYTGLVIKMIDHTVSDISVAKPVSKPIGHSGTWKSSKKSVIGNITVDSPDFRVPRSIDYRKPAVDFTTGTSCLDALNRLAEMTSCVFVVQPDGIGYFFELNDMGYPYYCDNQVNIVLFSPEDIISLNISPYLDNKFNFFVTSGFVQKKSRKTKEVISQSVSPKFIFTSVKPSGSNFPWSRMAVNVENGYLTTSEIAEIHANNVKFGLADMYQGTLNVIGNDRVTHIYQRIRVCGIDFFVVSIDHNINLQTKEWTTSYGLNRFVPATSK